MLNSSVHVHQCGCGADLVLLHGWGMHSGVWQPLLPLLTPHFRVTCIDLPGHGHSTLADPTPTLDNVLDAIMAVAPKQAVWCGWSLGGLLLQRLAYDYSNRIIKACCIASTPYFVKQDTWPGLSETVLQQFLSQLTRDHQQTIERFIALQCLNMNEPHKQQRELKNHLATAPMPSERALTQALSWLTKLDCRSFLPKLTQPLYYLFGCLDAIVPVAIATKINQWQPNAHCDVIAKAGHIPFISHKEYCASFIKTHLI